MRIQGTFVAAAATQQLRRPRRRARHGRRLPRRDADSRPGLRGDRHGRRLRLPRCERERQPRQRRELERRHVGDGQADDAQRHDLQLAGDRAADRGGRNRRLQLRRDRRRRLLHRARQQRDRLGCDAESARADGSTPTPTRACGEYRSARPRRSATTSGCSTRASSAGGCSATPVRAAARRTTACRTAARRGSRTSPWRSPTAPRRPTRRPRPAAGGDYSFAVPSGATTLCVVETNEGDHRSTGASVGTTALPSGTPTSVGGTSYTYSRGTDTISFTAGSGTSYAGLNFGDVPDNSFSTNGQQSAAPGTTLYYPHTFIAGSAGTVTFSPAGARRRTCRAGARWSTTTRTATAGSMPASR